MKFENLFHLILIIFYFLVACNSPDTISENDTSIKISLSNDSSQVELSGIPKDILQGFSADSLDERQWHNFFAVFEEPLDPDLREIQRPLRGVYFIEGKSIHFKPENPFQKHHSYFVQCYARKIFVKPEDIIKTRRLPSRNEIQEVEFKF